ncbi:MAG TPA: hypothetical protein VHR43_15565 [Gemmatimonadales bacterium]|nr:hypothetical protein [Gemmatimonadales bacterium]
MSPRALVLAAGWLSAACAAGSRPPQPLPAPAPDPCLIAGDSAAPPRPITVLFDDESAALNARQAAGRLAPVRLDCEGRVRPGLAQAWTRDSTGSFWTLVLRRPSDSAGMAPRWTAAALAATWRTDPVAASALRLAGVTSAVPLDERRLVVGLASPSASLPPVFADRALGVTVGGGPGMAVSTSAGDLRDAVDSGADVIVTADPAVLDYAARHPSLRQVALPWSRRYLLVLFQTVPGLLPADTAGFRAALARDAVRAEARPVPQGDWSDSTARCSRTASGSPVSVSDAVVYPVGDAAARELAERLMALANGAWAETRPLDPAALATALARAEARAFVVRTAARALSPCAVPGSWPAEAAVVPLIDVRAHAIVRPGTPPLTVEGDAAIRPFEQADSVEARP